MAEKNIVQVTPTPRTNESLAQDLRQLGLKAGMALIMHSSLSALGWVCGGPVAVVQAVMDVVTAEGTIVMPTQTGDYTDPAQWQNPPVPREWWPIIYEHMPAFDPQVTPSYHMGQIVETFRTWPGTLRSNHPLLSFAAWGKNARQITENQALDYGLGEKSPLARIYELDGWILLLGVGHDSNTSLHLAEYRAPDGEATLQGSPIYEDGQRVWKSYRDIELNADLFPEIGRAYEEETGAVTIGQVGSATARLLRQRPAVDYAVQWFTSYRSR